MKIALGIMSVPLIADGVIAYFRAESPIQQIVAGVLLTAGFVALSGAAICDRLDAIKEQSVHLAAMNK